MSQHSAKHLIIGGGILGCSIAYHLTRMWTLWGLIQHADGNPAEDFWAYATGRFERCKALMQDPAFQAHVDAVRAG